MKTAEYLVDWNEVRKMQVRDLCRQFKRRMKIRLSDLKLSDLIFFRNRAIKSGRGVYLFYQGSDCVRVGKNSSRHFINRIPEHLNISPDSWMNHLLISRRKSPSSRFYDKEAKWTLEHLSLLLINFKLESDVPKYCVKLEKGLRWLLVPNQNYLKRPSALSASSVLTKKGDLSVEDWLSEFKS